MKIISANTVEFGQNLDLRCQLFLLLNPASQNLQEKAKNPHLLVRLEFQEQVPFLPRALEAAEGGSEEMVSIRVGGNHQIAAE